MTWTLLVLGHRDPSLYQTECIRRIDEVVGLGFFDRLVMSRDTEGVGHQADTHGPWDVLHTGGGKGLSANVQQAWDALGPDEWVFHVEEDFLIDDAPLVEMAEVLASTPRLANMVLLRQPEPLAPGEVAWGVYGAQGGLVDRDGWLEHSNGFWLNPCVYHSSIALHYRAGTESVLTAQMAADGRTFGYWGGFGDPPRCTHVGTSGRMGSPGWVA